MASIPTTEPTKVQSGDTVVWQRSLADYPASAGWVLAYRLINSAGKIDLTATSSGDTFTVTAAALDTAAWTAGEYDWVAFVTKAAERYTVGQGRITVLANWAAAAAGVDTRTVARKMLDALEAVLQGRMAKADLEYQIGNRRMKSMSHEELLKARDKLKREVAGEERAARIAAGLGGRSRVLTRF